MYFSPGVNPYWLGFSGCHTTNVPALVSSQVPVSLSFALTPVAASSVALYCINLGSALISAVLTLTTGILSVLRIAPPSVEAGGLTTRFG